MSGVSCQRIGRSRLSGLGPIVGRSSLVDGLSVAGGETEGLVRINVKQSAIELVQGNIVDQDVDAIVNAANSSLLGGGGGWRDPLCGWPRAAGRVPHAGRLPHRRGAHHQRLQAEGALCDPYASGPVYRTIGRINWDGDDTSEDRRPEAELLASAHRSSLALASQHGIKTIAFPSISTGAYWLPAGRGRADRAADRQRLSDRPPSRDRAGTLCAVRMARRAWRSSGRRRRCGA